MEQRIHQLREMKLVANKCDYIFVSPDTQNISFGCDYLKQFYIQ